MTDMFTQTKRSAVMRAIKSKDTKPEMIFRRLVHGLGFRYRLHKSNLPGKPDLVFAKRGKIIFVHGCFWHGHAACKGGHLPKSNVADWSTKIEKNRMRDKKAMGQLRSRDWGIMTVWECQTERLEALMRRIVRFLGREQGAPISIRMPR